jgi:hypothetical protein
MEPLRRLIFLYVDAAYLGDFKLQDTIMDELANQFITKRRIPTPTRIPKDILRYVENSGDTLEGPLMQFCIDYFDVRLRRPGNDVHRFDEDTVTPWWVAKGMNRWALLRKRGDRGDWDYGFYLDSEQSCYHVPRHDRNRKHPCPSNLWRVGRPVCRIGHEGHKYDDCIRRREKAKRMRISRENQDRKQRDKKLRMEEVETEKRLDREWAASEFGSKKAKRAVERLERIEIAEREKAEGNSRKKTRIEAERTLRLGRAKAMAIERNRVERLYWNVWNC